VPKVIIPEMHNPKSTACFPFLVSPNCLLLTP